MPSNVQIIQLATTVAHILALDSTGIIWWRRWDKKGWQKMEQVPLSAAETTQSVSPIVKPSLVPMPEIIPPVVIPTPAVKVPEIIVPAQTISSHQDPA